MSWVIYSKETDAPIWKSDNRSDLEVIMANLKIALGDKFYIDKKDKAHY
jgi:hypothetical protein